MAAGSLSTVARATARPCSSTTQTAVPFTDTSSQTKCCMAASLSRRGRGDRHAAGQAAETAPRIPHLSPARRRACVEHVTAELGVSERLACKVLGQHRSTQRKAPSLPDDEAALREEIIALAKLYGRYGYRRVTAARRGAGGGTHNQRGGGAVWG